VFVDAALRASARTDQHGAVVERAAVSRIAVGECAEQRRRGLRLDQRSLDGQRACDWIRDCGFRPDDELRACAGCACNAGVGGRERRRVASLQLRTQARLHDGDAQLGSALLRTLHRLQPQSAGHGDREQGATSKHKRRSALAPHARIASCND
jgi:hypothetical protein